MSNGWNFPDEVDALGNAADAANAAVQQVQSFGGSDEAAARKALNAFWSLKASLYALLDEEGQHDADVLDVWVKNLWSRMAQNLSFMAAKDDEAAQARYANEAQQAASAALALSSSAGLDGTPIGYSAQQAAKDAASIKAFGDKFAVDATYGTAFKDRVEKVMTIKVLGVPAWAWAAGGIAAYLYLNTRARR